MQDSPFFRQAGAGPGVVCLHANASSSSRKRAGAALDAGEAPAAAECFDAVVRYLSR